VRGVISGNESWNTELQGFLDVQAMEAIKLLLLNKVITYFA
jgi:hypothetical protein